MGLKVTWVSRCYAHRSWLATRLWCHRTRPPRASPEGQTRLRGVRHWSPGVTAHGDVEASLRLITGRLIGRKGTHQATWSGGCGRAPGPGRVSQGSWVRGPGKELCHVGEGRGCAGGEEPQGGKQAATERGDEEHTWGQSGDPVWLKHKALAIAGRCSWRVTGSEAGSGD